MVNKAGVFELNDEHTIYVVLSMSGTKFSKFLKFFSGLEFTHVSLSLDEDLNTLYSFGRKKLNRPWIAGYVEEHPDKGIFKMYNPMCEVLAIKISNEKYLKLLDTISYVQAHSKEYKYNFFGLVCTFFKIPHKLHRHFTCTQFIAWLLGNIDTLPNVDKDISLIIPSDYYKISDIKSIYKGRLLSYACA